jgi:hypothetical protein
MTEPKTIEVVVPAGTVVIVVVQPVTTQLTEEDYCQREHRPQWEDDPRATGPHQ